MVHRGFGGLFPVRKMLPMKHENPLSSLKMTINQATCIITGAARGIGLAICEQLHGRGARLVMSVTETRGQGEDPYKPLREIDGRLEDMAGALVRVAGAMAGPEQAQAIDRAWHERAFPQVYRPTDGERRLQAALAMEGLTADQADVLAALRDEVARLADTRRAAWLAAARQAEAASTLPPGVELQVGGDGAPADPVAQARESVRAIDTRIEGGLEAVLTADQIAQLPARVPEYVQVSPWQGEAPIRFQQRGGG